MNFENSSNLKPAELVKDNYSQSETTKTSSNKKFLGFSDCPDQHKDFIQDTTLEKLIYWKLNALFDNSDEPFKTDILKVMIERVERPLFAFILQKTKGNQSKAAHVLGCNRNTLHRKLKEFSVEPRNLRQTLKNTERLALGKMHLQRHYTDSN